MRKTMMSRLANRMKCGMSSTRKMSIVAMPRNPKLSLQLQKRKVLVMNRAMMVMAMDCRRSNGPRARTGRRRRTPANARNFFLLGGVSIPIGGSRKSRLKYLPLQFSRKRAAGRSAEIFWLADGTTQDRRVQNVRNAVAEPALGRQPAGSGGSAERDTTPRRCSSRRRQHIDDAAERPCAGVVLRYDDAEVEVGLIGISCEAEVEVARGAADILGCPVGGPVAERDPRVESLVARSREEPSPGGVPDVGAGAGVVVVGIRPGPVGGVAPVRDRGELHQESGRQRIGPEPVGVVVGDVELERYDLVSGVLEEHGLVAPVEVDAAGPVESVIGRAPADGTGVDVHGAVVAGAAHIPGTPLDGGGLPRDGGRGRNAQGHDPAYVVCRKFRDCMERTSS